MAIVSTMVKLLKRVAKFRQRRKDPQKNLSLESTQGNDEDPNNILNVGKRSTLRNCKSQSDRNLSERFLSNRSNTKVVSYVHDPAIDSRNEELKKEGDPIFATTEIREEFENEEESSTIALLNDDISLFITAAETSQSEADDESTLLSYDSVDETSHVSYATSTTDKSCDEISLIASSDGRSSFKNKEKQSKEKNSFFGRMKDRVSQTVENFQRRVSETTHMIIVEVHGAYLDTTSAFGQVCCAFTLQEDEINAVCKRVDKAYVHYDRRIDTLEPVIEMSSQPMGFECKVLKIF